MQQQSYRSPFRTDLTCLDIKRILTVICGWSSSDIFFVKASTELIRMPELRVHASSLLIPCYLLLRVSPRPYLQKYHCQAKDVIISYCSRSCLHKPLHLKWYSNLPLTYLTLQLPDQICNSPYRQPYNSYNVSSENLVFDQPIIPKLLVFFFHITCMVDIVLCCKKKFCFGHSWELKG